MHHDKKKGQQQQINEVDDPHRNRYCDHNRTYVPGPYDYSGTSIGGSTTN